MGGHSSPYIATVIHIGAPSSLQSRQRMQKYFDAILFPEHLYVAIKAIASPTPTKRT